MPLPAARPARLSRRDLLAAAAAATTAALPVTGSADEPAPPLRPVRFGVSTYSFWQFRAEPAPIETCIDEAARMGFDGVEILQVQMMEEESNGRLQKLKRQAHSLGLALCGFSTHQGFVSPDPAVRRENIDKTLHSIDLAYRLGIPTMRVNTGRWGTSKNFDELMANRGIEPRLPGHTDEEGFGWVIESLEECLPRRCPRAWRCSRRPSHDPPHPSDGRLPARGGPATRTARSARERESSGGSTPPAARSRSSRPTPRSGCRWATASPATSTGPTPSPWPIVQFLPRRLADIELVTGEQWQPVITDTFILVPLPPPGQQEPVVVTFRGRPDGP